MGRVVLFLLFGFLASCTQIPQAELTTYVNAVSVSRSQGEALTADWQAATEEFQRRQAVSNPAPAQANALPFGELDSATDDDKLQGARARLLAWQAIGAYTDVLGQLAAGKGVDEVKSTAGRLFDVGVQISGAAFPGAGALSELLQTLVGELEKARQAAEFKKAIKAAGPTVRRIVSEVFIPDITSHYGLRTALAAEDFGETYVQSYKSPNTRAVDRKRIEDEIEALRQSLLAYRNMLLQLNASIVTLEQAVDAPPDFVSEANRLLDVAFLVKQHWLAYENAKAEARS